MSEEEEILFAQHQDGTTNTSTTGASTGTSTTRNGSISGHDFDDIVGFLEEMLIDETFVETQNQFFHECKDMFSESEDNTIETFVKFQDYVDLMEKHIESRLNANFEGISITDVAVALVDKSKQVTDDVVDMLTSITDFKEFKDLILSYKNEELNSTEGISLLSLGK